MHTAHYLTEYFDTYSWIQSVKILQNLGEYCFGSLKGEDHAHFHYNAALKSADSIEVP